VFVWAGDWRKNSRNHGSIGQYLHHYWQRFCHGDKKKTMNWSNAECQYKLPCLTFENLLSWHRAEFFGIQLYIPFITFLYTFHDPIICVGTISILLQTKEYVKSYHNCVRKKLYNFNTRGLNFRRHSNDVIHCRGEAVGYRYLSFTSYSSARSISTLHVGSIFPIRVKILFFATPSHRFCIPVLTK